MLTFQAMESDFRSSRDGQEELRAHSFKRGCTAIVGVLSMPSGMLRHLLY